MTKTNRVKTWFAKNGAMQHKKENQNLIDENEIPQEPFKLSDLKYLIVSATYNIPKGSVVEFGPEPNQKFSDTSLIDINIVPFYPKSTMLYDIRCDRLIADDREIQKMIDSFVKKVDNNTEVATMDITHDYQSLLETIIKNERVANEPNTLSKTLVKNSAMNTAELIEFLDKVSLLFEKAYSTISLKFDQLVKAEEEKFMNEEREKEL